MEILKCSYRYYYYLIILVVLSAYTWHYHETITDNCSSCFTLYPTNKYIKLVFQASLHDTHSLPLLRRQIISIYHRQKMLATYLLISMYFVFRKFIMSHHIVTVCVVCVLCAAHVPCSAHTNPSGTVRNSTNTRDPSSPDEQSFSALISSQDTSQPYTKRQSSYPQNFISNKRDTVRFHSTRYVNRNNNNNNNNVPVAINTIPTASHDAYLLKKEITENFKGGGNARNTQVASADVSVNLRDVELLERLAQTELLSNIKHESSADLRTEYRSRLKRDVAVDEMYFMRKLFEAYGDGTSITMEGFEKLVRKLGLLRLLTDASKQESGSTETSMYKN